MDDEPEELQVEGPFDNPDSGISYAYPRTQHEPKEAKKIDLERGLLGSIVQGNDEWYKLGIEPEDFSIKEHAEMFRFFRDRHAKGESVDDLLLLDAALSGNDSLSRRVGRIALIASVADGAIRKSNTSETVQELKKLLAVRKWAKASEQIYSLSTNPDALPAEEALRRTKAILDRCGKDCEPVELSQVIPVAELKDYLTRAEVEVGFIVDGLIYHGAAHMLMGTIKAGKTVFLLLLAKAMMRGEEFLGMRCEPTNVLYVTEQPSASFKVQLREADMLEGGGDKRKSFYILDLSNLYGLDWPGRASLIRETAKKHECGLVIVDTFVRVALISKIESAGELNAAYEQIAPLTTIDHRAVVLNWP